MNNRSLRDNVMNFVFLLMAGLMLCQIYDRHVPYSIALNISASIPKGLYLSKRPVPAKLSRDEIGCFRYFSADWAKTRHYFPEGMQLCKHALGLPGDSLRTSTSGLTIETPDKTTTYDYTNVDKAGRNIPPAVMPAVIQPGQYVMLAPANKNSMDSRYLGIVKHSDITRTLTPILTW